MRLTRGRAAVAAGVTAALAVSGPAIAAGLSDTHSLAPRVKFTMQPDGSSGRTQSGAGIPNIDSVKSTIRTYYNATDGIADKKSSPYIREMSQISQRITPQVVRSCQKAVRAGEKPAVVLDADDTTLMTYDMEDNAMNFVFDPTLQDVWVQGQKFPATPHMVSLVNQVRRAGCTIVGLTGRNDDQKTATINNLKKVGYTGFTSKLYFTKWTGKGESQQPSWVKCATAKCTTIEYKSQTRKHVENDLGYTIVANFGDQFSDLSGGYSDRTVKLPNPTYYLP
ncbi:HAD family acid phosphatase [Dermacoccaceae bacterium W4C1]